MTSELSFYSVTVKLPLSWPKPVLHLAWLRVSWKGVTRLQGHFQHVTGGYYELWSQCPQPHGKHCPTICQQSYPFFFPRYITIVDLPETSASNIIAHNVQAQLHAITTRFTGSISQSTEELHLPNCSKHVSNFKYCCIFKRFDSPKNTQRK